MASEAPALSVEHNGINAVPPAERRGRPSGLFWPWAAANLSLFGVAFGVYVVGLGLGVVPAILTGSLGYLLSFALVGLVSVAGARSGVPTMTLGRAAFGRHGNRLPTLLSYVSNVGWEIVLVPVGALAAALPTWFLLPYLLAAIGGFLSGAIMDIYSSGLSMLALGVPVKRHLAVLVDGVLMLLGGYYLLFVSANFLATFQAFLAIIGVVMAAWVAVFLVDMWRWRDGGRRYDEGLLRAGAPAVNWPGVISLVVASVVGMGLIVSSDPNIATVVGFLMSDGMRAGTFGAANIGVVVALVLAGVLYYLLTLARRPPEAAAAPPAP